MAAADHRALQERLAGSYARCEALPSGRAGLIVYWKGFLGHDPLERRELVRGIIATLGSEATKRVATIFALTPEEASEIGERR